MRLLRQAAPLLLLLAAGGALLYVGWTTLDRPDGAACAVCGRAVHLASRVDASSGDEALTFCCAACALRAKEQQGREIEISRVFDYESGEALSPDQAVAVVGSDVNLCMREHVLMDSHKEASELHFDRCSPSVLAFSSPRAAEAFRAEHGGVVKPLSELEGSFE